MHILITDGIARSAASQLRALGHDLTEQFYAPEDLGNALTQFDCVIVRSATKVRKEHLDIASGGRLKLIIRGGVGLDNIDVAYAESLGIIVRNTPGASSASVAELALGHMFACSRFLSIAGKTMRHGQWEKKAYGKGIEISGKTLGIIGYGRIGSCLGEKAQALGMKILAYANHPKPELESDTLHYVDLDTLFAQSDFISLHCPAKADGPIINRESISKMKDGVVIINTSRGANLDEDALLEALNSEKVRSAGLDVFAEEPTHNLELLQHPMVSCSPHIGAATKEAQTRIGAEIVHIIATF